MEEQQKKNSFPEQGDDTGQAMPDTLFPPSLTVKDSSPEQEDDTETQAEFYEDLEEELGSTSGYTEAPPQNNVNPLILGLTIALVFILGLALGFFGRPVIIEDLPIEVVVTVVPDESQALAQAQTSAAPEENVGNERNSNPVSENHQTEMSDEAISGEPTPTIMDFVLSDARHFRGDEAAEVTIVEFSDFN